MKKGLLKNIKPRNVKKILQFTPPKSFFCKKCVVSNQRPRIVFDKDGV